MYKRLLLGPPGCGKTGRLLTEMERLLNAGVPPSRIAFASFTKAAVREARERAIAKFNLVPDDLPWFRTLHSLAFRQLGLRRSDVLDRRDLARLADVTGEELTGHHDLDAPTIGERGDALLFLDQTARARLVPLEAEWRRHGAFIDWYRLERFVSAYGAFRADVDKIDFTDILERYVAAGDPVPVEAALLDEVQDLTPLQWRVVDRAFGHANLLVAGDDDQTIYAWAGADAAPLINLDAEREVLGQSFRLPRAVHALAQTVAARISHRNPKRFQPREVEGSVEWLTRPDEVDLSSGEWLMLARTRRQLAELVDLARAQGVSYVAMGVPAVDPRHVRLILDWEALRAGRAIGAEAVERLIAVRAVAKRELDGEASYRAADLGLASPLAIWHDALIGLALDEREYLLSCLRRGEKLTEPARVRVSTVHGAKGTEADHVLLLTDLTSRVWRGIELDPDAEQRVLYVAITRAKQALHIVEPRGRFGYQL